MPSFAKLLAFKDGQRSHVLCKILIVADLILITACSGLGTATKSTPESPTPPPVTQPIPHAPPLAPQTPSPARPDVNPPAITPNPADLIFFDSFEYSVGRNDADAETLFQKHGKWHRTKTVHSRARANGYLYTTTSIPGYNGIFPGGNSHRVLVMEALPKSRGSQTDFYLQYGDGEDPAYNEAIPGNVWFQFWLYINHNGNQLSQIDARNKFIYACNGSYPCHTGKWLLSLVNRSEEPYWQDLGIPSRRGGFLTNAANPFEGIGEVTNTTATSPENRYKLGHTDTSRYIAANRWTLVKIHIDTSTESGKYEAWMRPQGDHWVKVAEWIDGVTPGFRWRISPEHIGGHRVIRMPTTMGRASGGGYDAWIYMDDFAMARSEAGLPRYGQ